MQTMVIMSKIIKTGDKKFRETKIGQNVPRQSATVETDDALQLVGGTKERNDSKSQSLIVSQHDQQYP